MRRSLLAGIGVAAVLFLAACSPDQPRREPLAPADAGLAKGGGGGGGGGSQQCAGPLAVEIGNLQDALYDGAGEDSVEAWFTAVKTACPLTAGDSILMAYLKTMIQYSGAPTSDPNRAKDLDSLVAKVTRYATNSSVNRDQSIFESHGGAAVLSPGEFMTTWDDQARLEIQLGTNHSGPHLWTFEPASGCDGTTSLELAGNCYQVHDYPDETTAYDPPFIVTICPPLHPVGGSPPSGIAHETADTSDFQGAAEVLPDTIVAYGCGHIASALDSWLGRKAGPLGRAVARAYDYLRPRPLFAEDAGESGLGLFTSLFGQVLTTIFSDNFDDTTTFNAQFSNPPVADAPDVPTDIDWLYKSQSPGYIRIQDALGDMSGGVVVLSQGQGACNNCPLFRLLGTRENAGDDESVGSYAISWKSLQNKPSIKEAPFVILNALSINNNTHNKNIEIARLSYVTVPNSLNKLLFIVRGVGNNDSTVFDVGNWVKDTSQTFTVTVNLTMLNSSLSQTVSLSIDGVPFMFPVPSGPPVLNYPAPRATLLKQIGYVLAGIDAGVIASDNWVITRLEDIPPP